MNTLAPIVLFTYNRLWHTQQTIEALQKNELSNESELFIYSDGWKGEDDRLQVLEVREYLKSIKGFKEITIIQRDKNWGLADSIIDGVTDIVNRYGKIIVLEDDIVTSPYFLKYINEALEYYDDNEEIWHISGYLYPTCDGISKDDTFFLNVATCWGWATWSRAWRNLETNCDKLISLLPEANIKRFNLDGAYNWYSHLLLNQNKTMKTWAIKWYVSMFIKSAFCLHPKFSLTKNIGNDNSGVHCGENLVFTNQILKDIRLKIKIKKLVEDHAVREQLKKFFVKGA